MAKLRHYKTENFTTRSVLDYYKSSNLRLKRGDRIWK